MYKRGTSEGNESPHLSRAAHLGTPFLSYSTFSTSASRSLPFPKYSISSLSDIIMCKREVWGDYYTVCQHFVVRHHGEKTQDCGRPTCRFSDQHVDHGYQQCRCAAFWGSTQKVQNKFRMECMNCQNRGRSVSDSMADPFYDF
ncbi:hypothetical protein SISNIDRAFT_321400 [Sistotremastrum niveocremeum HHB9708]|uniref:Uncharacterized protein n=2 Tax=Sistotremastraceae TaxID=3402574 RepID=A0A164MWF7_9AGAM|nr:hypothetical protein SISNIDRAFT_321400 [Sistotremastrum niveocremeum HHB9708]KZT32046.1 hypothetical protein SISSUDRAFT_592282 [Sistotremastrum suecicum HHB10207 ss-3]